MPHRFHGLARFLVLSQATLLCHADEPAKLRVLTYNIHHGAGVDGKVNLDRIAGVIRAATPDVVALQEVDCKTRRTQQVDQPRLLAKLTGMKVVFGDNIDFQGGRYGNAVLSRFPITRHQNYKLPSEYEGEQRGCLEVELRLPDDSDLLFLATHFDSRRDSTERLASAKFVNELVAERGDMPAVLAGDLNAMPDSPTLKLLRERWQLSTEAADFTFPAEQPTRQIDFVLTRPVNRWQLVETKVIDEPVASDHRPLLAVFRCSP